MDKKQAVEIAGIYAAMASKAIDVKSVILYGSYARGDAGPDSDIDLAVVVDHLKEDFLDTEFKLFRLRRDLDDRIEPILINEKTDKSGFLEEIRRSGILVYGQ